MYRIIPPQISSNSYKITQDIAFNDNLQNVH